MTKFKTNDRVREENGSRIGTVVDYAKGTTNMWEVRLLGGIVVWDGDIMELVK